MALQDDIASLLDRYGSTSPVETREQRIARLTSQVQSGSRTIQEIESALKASQGKPFDWSASAEYGGPSSSTIDPIRSQVSSLFSRYGRGATPLESVDQQVDRIARQIASGARSLASVEADIKGSIGKPFNYNAPAEYGGLGANAPAIGTSATTQALPQGSRLAYVNGQYRVLWNLPVGGTAWYSISPERLQQVYGNSRPNVAEAYTSDSAFQAKYGNNFWGDISEVTQTAKDPWQDMSQRILNAFGYVPGMDEPEVQRMLMQAWFEGWSPDQFMVEYKNTRYFNNQTDQQRAWAGMSEAERNFTVQQTALDLVEQYRRLWGVDPAGGVGSLMATARQIASGAMPRDQWIYEQRRAAEGAPNTPAGMERFQQERSMREPEISQENLAAQVAELWRSWMGPVAMPPDFSSRWGKDLYLNLKSTADLEAAMKSISQGAWPNKPPDIPWSDWAAPWRGQIGNLLEVGTVDPNDPLLTRLLAAGFTGQDAIMEIRRDPRFLRTQTYYNELSKTLTDMGRMFGFIG